MAKKKITKKTRKSASGKVDKESIDLSFDPKSREIQLPEIGSWKAAPHQFDEDAILAVQVALAANRPLLIRGEAGIGKSQLARAVAFEREVPFLYQVVTARCEPRDLLYRYDAVRRLAQAQAAARPDLDSKAEHWDTAMAERRFVRPQPFWWALNWASAKTQEREGRIPGVISETEPSTSWEKECLPLYQAGELGWTPERSKRGCVVLIDEIDKADADLPNGLLETLGNNGFEVDPTGEIVTRPEDRPPPLVILTTNEERELPAAFLRRCLVLQMTLGTTEPEQTAFLIRRGRKHASKDQVNDATLQQAAELLLRDREVSPRFGPALPGAAEYIDLVRTLARLYPGEHKKQQQQLDRIRPFVFLKNKNQEVATAGTARP